MKVGLNKIRCCKSSLMDLMVRCRVKKVTTDPGGVTDTAPHLLPFTMATEEWMGGFHGPWAMGRRIAWLDILKHRKIMLTSQNHVSASTCKMLKYVFVRK